MRSLEALVDQVLINSLTESLRDTIDHALEAGGTRQQIMKAVCRVVRRDSLTALAVEAYLEAKEKRQ